MPPAAQRDHLLCAFTCHTTSLRQAYIQDKLTRQNGSIGAPDTPAADDMEEPMIGRTARQRKRKDIDVVDERSDRMAKRMVSPITLLLCMDIFVPSLPL